MSHRNILLLILLLQISFGQSIYNAVGLGMHRDNHSAAALGIGSTGLIPSHFPNISLDNPNTWHNSKFALLSGGFGGETIIPNSGLANTIVDLSRIQLILPVKGKYALGLDLSPITDGNYWLKTISSELFVSDDTLTSFREIEGAGGINSMRLSFSFPLTEYEQNGLAIHILFGSSRHNSIFDIEGTEYIYSRHLSYSGLSLVYYLSSSRYKFKRYPINLHGSIGFSLSPLKLKSIQYHLFEDANGNGYYDSFVDSPYMTSDDSRIESSYSDVQNPFEIKIGYDLELESQLHLTGEISYLNANIELPNLLRPLNGTVYNSIKHVNFGAIKFARKIPREWYQYFHYRAGLYLDQRSIQGYGENLVETGLSLGLGFRFGFTNNQIDLAYSNGSRKGPLSTTNERIERFRIQVTLGDIWFVKRRAR